MRQMNNIKGISFALLASVTFGFLPLFSKPLIDMGLPVSSLLFYRFLISAVIVSAICAAGRVNLRVTGRQLAILAFLAVLYVLSGTCLVRSYVYIPSGIATTIHFMYPVAVTAIMVFVFKERKSKTIFTAMLLAITGVALLSWNTAAPLNTKGLLLAGSTIFAYAIYLIMVNRSSVSRLDSMPMMFYIFVIGSAVFALSTVIDGGIRQPEGAFQWSMITGLAIISTNDYVAQANTYWNQQGAAAEKYASIFYWRSRWSELEPEEGKYAWEHDENFKALIQGALDRGLKLAFRVYIDGQDNIHNGTPDFVREAGAKGYAVHKLWDPANENNNWTPYADDPVFQEKFGNFIRAFAKEFDNPKQVDFIDAYNLGWWGEGHHVQYLNNNNKFKKSLNNSSTLKTQLQ